VSFFDQVPEESRPEPPEQLFAPAGPLWLAGPDQYYLPALLPWNRELGRAGGVVVALNGIRVWPDCCTLDIAMFSRRAPFHGVGRPRLGLPLMEPTAPGGFRFGVLFSDGRRATNLDRDPRLPASAGPVLRTSSSHGGQFHHSASLLLWPLPPPGPLTIVVQWPDQELPETSTELDGAAIRHAASEAIEIWSDLPPAPANQPPRVSYGHSTASMSAHSGAQTARRVRKPPEKR
jgi:hypothetical protein